MKNSYVPQKLFLKILVIGEAAVLFNGFINNFTLKAIEDEGNRVIVAPLSEYMWFLWKDFSNNTKSKKSKLIINSLDKLKGYINIISDCLAEESPFEKDIEGLGNWADKHIKYYSGGN